MLENNQLKINLLTVNERPLFPGGVTTLVISRDEEIHLIEQLAKSNRPFGVVLTRLRSPEDMSAPLFPGIYQVGTLCRVNRFVRLPNGTLHVFVNTLSSFFIEKVEKDRIEKLSKEDPQFFYHVLSYAMALDTEDEWVRAFSGMYVEPARWYHGDDVADIYILSSFSRRWNHAYSSVIAPQPRGGGARTTRGSSGFSGGGFSGGGGRSW